MPITPLCRELALAELFQHFEPAPAQGLLVHALERLWEHTGLRRADFESALREALQGGHYTEQQTEHGRLILRRDAAEPAAPAGGTLRQIEERAQALETLAHTRARRRRGYRPGGRRQDDLRVVPGRLNSL